MKPTYIVGISAFYHDSAACLLKDGQIIAAAQEERFTRKKNEDRFPRAAVEYCLAEGGISISDVAYVSYYEKPLLKFERLLETYLEHAPKGFASFSRAMPLWMSRKLWIKDIVRKELNYRGEICFTEHHEAHAASAFYPSPFDEAAFLTVDGVGEWATATYGTGRERELSLLGELHFPHSLGLLYSAFTQYLGFEVNSGEYKVMGLAPYGQARYAHLIETQLFKARGADGSFELNMQYFDYPVGLSTIHPRFEALFGAPARQAGEPITQLHKDVARSIQEVTNTLMRDMAIHVRTSTGRKNLCLAGGVALNCVANSFIRDQKLFDQIWIQPAAGDAGGAVGAAYSVWHRHLHQPRHTTHNDSMQRGLLGPAYSDADVERALRKAGARYEKLDEEALITRVGASLAKGAVVGWFQGRMEFGPRALGNRSILADPRDPTARDRINGTIKERELFRPFAPSVLEEHAREYFGLENPSPYMLFTASVAPEYRSLLPAVTHVDGSARVQTVTPANGRYYRLLAHFASTYECPALLNTSFNGKEEPIVCTPEDACASAKRLGLEDVAIGSFFVSGFNSTPVESSRKTESKEPLSLAFAYWAMRAWATLRQYMNVLLLFPIFLTLCAISLAKKGSVLFLEVFVSRPGKAISYWQPKRKYAPHDRQY